MLSLLRIAIYGVPGYEDTPLDLHVLGQVVGRGPIPERVGSFVMIQVI